MRFRTIAVAAAFALASGAAFAGPTGKEKASAGNASAEKPKFEHLDDNGSGYVERKEAADMSAISKSFGDADANGDGKLSRKEFEQLVAR